MKKGETRAAYLTRKAEENRSWVINRLEAELKFVRLQIARNERERSDT